MSATFVRRYFARIAARQAPPVMHSQEGASARLYPPLTQVDGPEEAAVLAGEQISGNCAICGNGVRFLAFTDNLRESGHCPRCGCSNRQRQMAWMLRHEFDLKIDRPLELPADLSIYNTEANGPLHELLRHHSHYKCSEYWGDKAVYGQTVNGVCNEDLQELSFADASFDVVLSSDVLEHMPQPYRAHAEIFRVLKPGGRHIFTVPYGEAMVRDDVRASLVDGRIEYHAKALYHGDPVRPDEGILVWTIFGMEMLVRLKEIGFDTEWWRLREPSCGIIGGGMDVFVARKPVSGPGSRPDVSSRRGAAD